ncbi:neutral/alkaline ceramidase [Aldersonia sp. NBC_00410]|uniref:neutral/alkaline non-lysosomal ceramidase N-terminal domain-containing protein n=1 Tax=Aldersonia sp. NBC_00410 TaxID=2975954 RepID=UPI00224DE06A|nr:neutral/alkaline non-lysosomal ceramidase N-terminal domain-containing protein [Aldersonia sp. NBC_00410]MCX5043123.1 neutral/alkaline ceramidase [Aldersonia sp. NBC_00410]
MRLPRSWRSAEFDRRRFLGASALTAAAALLGPAMATAAPIAGLRAGRGRSDVTGEIWGAGMLGYAVPEQISSGLHLRQYARAFVLADATSGVRVVHVTVDVGLMFQSVFEEVVRRLQLRYGNLYHRGNVLLGATHTHAGPGGQSGHAMVDITTFGFRPATFEAEVTGIVEAIVAAHDDVSPAQVLVSRGVVEFGGGNRSPLAFARNPAADKAQFPGGVDPTTRNLTIVKAGSKVGNINWFSTHGTSMPGDNRLISSDNKGYAALAAETEVHPGRMADGKPFVAAFAQATPGDISPNLTDGVGADRFAATALIGRRQLDGAVAALDSGTAVGSGIDHRYRYVDMRSFEVSAEFTGDGTTHRLTPAMLGASFAAGSTEDGGAGDDLPFNEAEYGGNPVVAQLNDIVVPAALSKAQEPKDILLPMGLIDGMIQQVLPFHLVRLGSFYLFTCPFEPTINAGLRLRRALGAVLGAAPDVVQVQGYTNAYAHYLTTPEEYDRQEYEGGATVFGRWQLPAVVQIATGLARDLVTGRNSEPEGPALDLTGRIPNSPTGTPFVDFTRPGETFGGVVVQPNASYPVGATASAVFVAANPNNVLRRNDTYLLVERRSDGGWVQVATDAVFETFLRFDKQGPFTHAQVDWAIPPSAASGTYRIRYFGDARSVDGATTPFVGESVPFTVG